MRLFLTLSINVSERIPNAIPPFGIHLEPHITNLNVDLDNIAEYRIPEIPLWTMGTAEFRFDLTSDKKSETNQNKFQVRNNEIKEYYFSFKPIYTDGSKDGNSVAAAAVYGTKVKKGRLPNKSSIFSAEVKAIDLALDLVEQPDSSRFIIFSDSLSSPQTLHNQKLENPSVCDVLERISHLVEFKRIVFCWLPSHMGIRGNKKADETAKSALSLPESNYKVSYTDFKTAILTYTQSFWQSQLDADLFNKLHSVKPTLGEWYLDCVPLRLHQIIQTFFSF